MKKKTTKFVPYVRHVLLHTTESVLRVWYRKKPHTHTLALTKIKKQSSQAKKLEIPKFVIENEIPIMVFANFIFDKCVSNGKNDCLHIWKSIN